MGSDESHFNVSLIVRDKVTRLSIDDNFGRERRAAADSNRGTPYRWAKRLTNIATEQHSTYMLLASRFPCQS